MDTCIICLGDLFKNNTDGNTDGITKDITEEILILSCKHIYHKSCFYRNICINGYKCPCRCNIDIKDNNLLEKLFYYDNKFIEKFTKRVTLPREVEKILKHIKWSENNIFIAGGFALSLYNNFQIPYSDIDIMCSDFSGINFTEFLLNQKFTITKKSTFNNNIIEEYSVVNNNVEQVIKLIDNENTNNLDIIKLNDGDRYLKKNKLTILINNTLEKFDISCCKIACTYQGDDNFTFYINPDYYNNRAYLDKNNGKKRDNTLNRIDKYEKKGIKNIEIIEI